MVRVLAKRLGRGAGLRGRRSMQLGVATVRAGWSPRGRDLSAAVWRRSLDGLAVSVSAAVLVVVVIPLT